MQLSPQIVAFFRNHIDIFSHSVYYEASRHVSYFSKAAVGRFVGLGFAGYDEAMKLLCGLPRKS